MRERREARIQRGGGIYRIDVSQEDVTLADLTPYRNFYKILYKNKILKLNSKD